MLRLNIFTKILVLSKNTSFLANSTQSTFVVTTKTLQILLSTTNKYLSLDTTGYYSPKLNILSNVRCANNMQKIDFIVPLPTKVFAGEGWEYREFNEFFQNTFQLKKDSRNLLLDYISTNKPLQKSYPTTGFSEFFYHNSKQITTYVPITNIEL